MKNVLVVLALIACIPLSLLGFLVAVLATGALIGLPLLILPNVAGAIVSCIIAIALVVSAAIATTKLTADNITNNKRRI